MKRAFLLSIVAIGLLVAYVALSVPEATSGPGAEKITQTVDQPLFPEAVHEILVNSCFDCHTSASQNEKAKNKLDFDKWGSMAATDKLAALDEICTEVTEGNMPTEKYLSYYPDKKLNEDQVNTLCTWTEKEGNKLLDE
jgi:hypothetical protein